MGLQRKILSSWQELNFHKPAGYSTTELQGDMTAT